MKIYIYNNKEYNSLYELRRDNRNLIFPANPSKELLELAKIEIVEKPDPVIPEPEPYVPTQEELLQQAKNKRKNDVENIIVEVDSMKFNGSEDSQRRMLMVIQTWQEETESIQWVLADDTIANVSKNQLQQALDLSVAEMTKLWTKPYTTNNA